MFWNLKAVFLNAGSKPFPKSLSINNGSQP